MAGSDQPGGFIILVDESDLHRGNRPGAAFVLQELLADLSGRSFERDQVGLILHLVEAADHPIVADVEIVVADPDVFLDDGGTVDRGHSIDLEDQGGLNDRLLRSRVGGFRDVERHALAPALLCFFLGPDQCDLFTDFDHLGSLRLELLETRVHIGDEALDRFGGILEFLRVKVHLTGDLYMDLLIVKDPLTEKLHLEFDLGSYRLEISDHRLDRFLLESLDFLRVLEGLRDEPLHHGDDEDPAASGFGYSFCDVGELIVH